MRGKNLLLILFLLLALLPYFLTCFYALPFADDFCYAWTSAEKISVLQKFLKQYLHWNGRYTSNLLINAHPLVTGKLIYYRLGLCLSLLAMPAVSFILIRLFVQDISFSIVASLLITNYYLCYQTDITNGIYWYIGACTYHLGNVCFVLQLAFLLMALSLKDKWARITTIVIAAILLVLSIGFNEIGAVLIPSYFLVALIPRAKKWDNNFKIMLAFFLLALVASAFVFFAPGNATRSSQYTEGFNWIHSLLYASLQSIRFTATWSLSLPFVILSLIVMAHADKLRNNVLLKADHRLVLILGIYTVFTGAFMPYLGTGILGQHRTMNYVYFFYIFFWIWWLINVSEKIEWRKKMSALLTPDRTFMLTVASVVIMIFSGNGIKILRDFSNNSFTAYKTAFMQRQELIIHHPEIEIAPLLNVPSVFNITDAKNDSSWYVNKCMNYFYADTRLELK